MHSSLPIEPPAPVISIFLSFLLLKINSNFVFTSLRPKRSSINTGLSLSIFTNPDVISSKEGICKIDILEE